MDGVTLLSPEVKDHMVRQEGEQGWGGGRAWGRGADKTSSTQSVENQLRS